MSGTIGRSKFVVAWAPALVWAFLIFVLSVAPYKIPPPLAVEHSDKMAHFLIYTVLAVLVIRSQRATGWHHTVKSSLFTLITCGVYGILMELTQLFVSGREASVLDAVADLIGAGLGIILGEFVLWRK